MVAVCKAVERKSSRPQVDPATPNVDVASGSARTLSAFAGGLVPPAGEAIMKGKNNPFLLTLPLLWLMSTANAQTFQLLHTFEGTDGLGPGALTIDSAGNLYGAAVWGGIHNCSSPGQSGCGTIFELSKSNWAFKLLYQFQSNTDGWSPNSPLTRWGRRQSLRHHPRWRNRRWLGHCLPPASYV